MAVAHAILGIASQVMQRQEPYRELETKLFDQTQMEMTIKRLVKRLQGMGYQ